MIAQGGFFFSLPFHLNCSALIAFLAEGGKLTPASGSCADPDRWSPGWLSVLFVHPSSRAPRGHQSPAGIDRGCKNKAGKPVGRLCRPLEWAAATLPPPPPPQPDERKIDFTWGRRRLWIDATTLRTLSLASSAEQIDRSSLIVTFASHSVHPFVEQFLSSWALA